MKLLIRLEAGSIYVAGFDGYSSNGDNYVHSYMASQHTKGQEENVKIRKYVTELKKKIPILFLTDSVYEK